MPKPSLPRDNPIAILDSGLFHQPYYQHQRSERFGTVREALEDFLDEGLPLGLSPHPLFDVPFYLRANPDVATTGVNPVFHYLSEGWRQGRDPHPLFDNDWYLTQIGFREKSNPLSHYLKHARDTELSPNRLFDSAFYLRENDDTVKAGFNPLEHYVLYGRDEGRLPDPRFQGLLRAWRDPLVSLTRGKWKRQHILWVAFQQSASQNEAQRLLRIIREISQRRRVEIRCILDAHGSLRLEPDESVKSVRLDDFGVRTTANPAFRLSSLRLLLFALSKGVRHVDLWQAAEAPLVTDAFADLGIPVASVSHQIETTPSGAGVEDEVEAVLTAPSLHLTKSRRLDAAARRVFVPCADWSLSGVHTAAQALGQELLARGWDFRLLFTRGTIGVLDHTTDGHGLPDVPYEFLDVSACHSAREHWAAIIRYLEWRAPCVVLATFDDFANAVAPALSDQVGIVGWLQSDENHYYESAYRLGRYWNAIAGVSRRIVEEVALLNPSFADRSHLIHNSTVRHDHVSERSLPTDDGLRLVYVGRMVQYQKRVLDVTTLVRELERKRVRYRFTLIGGSPTDDIEGQLRRELAPQLATGKVRLTGPLSRKQVLRELAAHNVFVLFSDFEGLPVSLIEAMACGCVPAVARAQSGIPDVVVHGENGLVFEDRDYAAWATALGDLNNNADRMAAMSSQARRTILDRFTVESMADRFEQLFSTVLQQIEHGTWTRPPALTWRSAFDDVLVPPSLHGKHLG